MVDRYTLSETSKWAGYAGIIQIVMGAISALCGLFFFIIGAAPGVIMIILGVKLRNAKEQADEILLYPEPNPEKLTLVLQNLNSYMKITFIYYLVMIILGVLGFLLSIILSAAILSTIPELMK